MESASMTSRHQANKPWEWPLARATATRLRATPKPRWLLVTAGRVWLTQSGSGPEGADVWLGTGAGQLLPAGSEWVAEGWPEARIELLEAPALNGASAPQAA